MNASNIYFYHGLSKPGSILIVPVGWMIAEQVQNSKAVCGLMLPCAAATPSCTASYGRLAKPLQEFGALRPKKLSPPMSIVIDTYEALLAKCGSVPEINLLVPEDLEQGASSSAAPATQPLFPRATAAKARAQAAQPPESKVLTAAKEQLSLQVTSTGCTATTVTTGVAATDDANGQAMNVDRTGVAATDDTNGQAMNVDSTGVAATGDRADPVDATDQAVADALAGLAAAGSTGTAAAESVSPARTEPQATPSESHAEAGLATTGPCASVEPEAAATSVTAMELMAAEPAAVATLATATELVAAKSFARF